MFGFILGLTSLVVAGQVIKEILSKKKQEEEAKESDKKEDTV